MNLFPDLQKRYTQEQLSAPEAQRLAEICGYGFSSNGGTNSAIVMKKVK
ncbi:MAG: hypothetical protein J6U46_07550 [Bacteroidaceae bacterium]|nr:hypothetical protein [Bacteroidaceae bacterium]MBO7348285.1 hypothetical protein [Bacteroidaceae bacterium]